MASDKSGRARSLQDLDKKEPAAHDCSLVVFKRSFGPDLCSSDGGFVGGLSGQVL